MTTPATPGEVTKKVSLYDLTRQMEDLLESEETTDEQLQACFGDIQQKAGNICQYLTILNGQVDVFKAEEKRISARRKSLEAQDKRIREYIKENMTALGIDSIKAGTFSISLAASQGSLVIDDEKAIPAKFITVETVNTIRKDEIKAALKAGEEIPGAHIEAGSSLRIR